MKSTGCSANLLGWGCLQHAFDYYAHNLTRHTKVGNNDQKADNYWYWFLSVATQRDLTQRTARPR